MKPKKSLVVHEDDAEREIDICGIAVELINAEISFPRHMSVALILIDPGKSSERHYHEKTEEIYYILEGTATMEIGVEKFELKAGHAVLIPIGEIHQITNTGKATLRFISMDSPIFNPQDVLKMN